MEHLRGVTMNERVHKAMEFWLESIKFVQECRKKEITHATKRQKENPHCSPIHDDKGSYFLLHYRVHYLFLIINIFFRYNNFSRKYPGINTGSTFGAHCNVQCNAVNFITKQRY